LMRAASTVGAGTEPSDTRFVTTKSVANEDDAAVADRRMAPSVVVALPKWKLRCWGIVPSYVLEADYSARISADRHSRDAGPQEEVAWIGGMEGVAIAAG